MRHKWNRRYSWWPCGGCGSIFDGCENCVGTTTMDVVVPAATDEAPCTNNDCGSVAGTHTLTSLGEGQECFYQRTYTAPGIMSCIGESLAQTFTLEITEDGYVFSISGWVACPACAFYLVTDPAGIAAQAQNATHDIEPIDFVSGECSDTLTLELTADAIWYGHDGTYCKFSSGDQFVFN